MWALIVGIGIISILSKAFLEQPESSKNNLKKRKKIFVSFAIEDRKYRDFLKLQSKRTNAPFSYIDMSVKQPWSESEWKDKCRTKIRKCDGVIVLISKNTWHSSGTRWEIKCAKEEGVPVVGMQVKKSNSGANLPELNGCKIINWTWPNLESIIKKF